jgi:hypothetical protein
MKSASIITMHFPCNYGAVLQTYGLSQYLLSLGCKVSVINYLPEYMTWKLKYNYIGDISIKKNPLKRILYLAYVFPGRYNRRRLFENFRKNELDLTIPCYTYDDLKYKLPSFDYYFCGSDQIWNWGNETIEDPAYFLQFAKNKGCISSYAASGSCPGDDDIALKKSVCKWIEELDYISMREDTLVSAYRKYVGKDIFHVCDPVLLLDREKWKLLSEKSTLQKQENYLLVYVIGDNDNILYKAYHLSKNLGLKLYCITDSKRKQSNVDKVFCGSPYDFLWLFKNADYVVTNSFHGTVFSVVFEKSFLACQTVISNQRILSLLRTLNISQAYIKTEIKNPQPAEIDYTEVNSNLDLFVQKSRNFVKEIIDAK